MLQFCRNLLPNARRLWQPGNGHSTREDCAGCRLEGRRMDIPVRPCVTALVRIVLEGVSKREAWRETWRQKSTAVNPRHILLSNHSGVSFAERTTTIAVNPRHIFLSNHSEFSQTNRAGCPSVT